MYPRLPAQVDLPAMEREIIDWWKTNRIFERSVAQHADEQEWVFFEGPPTANGTPGTHHVEARAFKDIFPRFHTMKGKKVLRKAGWDCHGLPVELAVERELGFSGKKDIEAYGIEEFNARCRESVLRHVGEFEAMTERMGYWVDTDDAYWTMDSDYIESVWWSLAETYRKGLLVQDHRVSPYCPRCGTTLSDHELAQGYELVDDPSVFVRCRVTGGPLAKLAELDGTPVDLLVWTTTPWTLVSNTAVAVNPDADYVIARSEQSPDAALVVAADLAESTLGDDFEVLARLRGAEMERTTYQAPFDLVEIPDAHYVILADYVTTTDGSGLVHTAPAFGAEDLAAARPYGLPVVNPVRSDGTFDEDVPKIGGVFFKKADDILVADLADRDVLFLKRDFTHNYPHCWRCHTPLIYYAQPSWYVRTTAIKDDLLVQNQATNWYPETIKNGRYGDWLANNVDWALSRNRYWGTPLPLWRCPDGHITPVESLADLGEKAGKDLSDLDPHRPFVDAVTIPCGECGQTAERVPEVIDCWYDSGAMPFAQWGYPHRGQEEFAARYPADYICEAIDQTRGWFYTLMVEGTLLFGESSYRNVVCLGHILDAEGRKMSKHLGNVLEPIPLMDQHGADAVRWFMLASGSPWQARRVSDEAINHVLRKVLLTYWNVASFQSLYASIADWTPADAPPASERTDLDRWALSRTMQTAIAVDASLEAFDTQRAGREIEQLVDDLSNWYVRRSRRRFWDGDPSALATLHECLQTVTLLMAPFTPFVTEAVWREIFAPFTGIDSVHLAVWPELDAGVIDEALVQDVALVRRLVDLGRAARVSGSVRTRQPLRRALVGASRFEQLPAGLRDELANELNVLELQSLGSLGADVVDVEAKANYRELGKRFAKRTPLVAAAIAETEAASLAATLRERGEATVVAADSEPAVVGPDDVIITETPREGWAVAAEGGETLALDLELDDELRALGAAREMVRALQGARKDAGLDVTDRITVQWSAADPISAQAVRTHATEIAGEVLATTFTEVDLPDGAAPGALSTNGASHRAAVPELGVEFVLEPVRV